MKCSACNGTGYISASQHQQDLPMSLRTIGLCRCWVCGGSGKLPDIGENMEEIIRGLNPQELKTWQEMESEFKDWLKEKDVENSDID